MLLLLEQWNKRCSLPDVNMLQHKIFTLVSPPCNNIQAIYELTLIQGHSTDLAHYIDHEVWATTQPVQITSDTCYILGVERTRQGQYQKRLWCFWSLTHIRD